MTPITAFVDESGDPHLSTDKPGTSKYFILTAILVETAKVPALLQQSKEIRTKYFQSGEMKSNTLKGTDYRRRITILDRLMVLDFKLYYLAVEKEKIFEDSGLRFKKSFLKFINGKLYNRLFTTYPEIEIVGDEHGSVEFMESLSNYLSAIDPA